MAAQNPAQDAFPDPAGFARYCRALNACKSLALRLYPQAKDMYPGGLLSMFSLDPSLLAPTCPIQVRAQAQEEQYAFLRELAGSLSIDPGPVPPPEVGQGVAPGPPLPPPQSNAAGSQMDGAALSHAQSPGRSLLNKSRSIAGIAEASLPQPPPCPTTWIKGRQRGDGKTDPRDYWKFCFFALQKRGAAMGNDELALAFTESQKEQGLPVTHGHTKWWTRDRDLQLRMYAAAGVKIGRGHLTTRLQTFWSDAADVVLALLSAWLKSGAANSLQREELPAAAVYYIRAERQKEEDNFWPDHGINLDVSCLTTGVVSEERLFHEWKESKAKSTQRVRRKMATDGQERLLMSDRDSESCWG